MKKKSIALTVALALAISSFPVCAAAEDDFNYDTLADWDIRIDVPPHSTATLSSDGNYYIYTQEYGSIPYVLVRAYPDFADEEDFVNGYFTDYMAENYADLEVIQEFQPVVIGSRDFYAIQYGYTVQGYDVTDIRIIKTIGDTTYRFASKEIEDLDMSVGDALLYVCENCLFLRDGEPIDESELGSGTGVGDGSGTDSMPDAVPRPEQNSEYMEVSWEDAEPALEELGISGDFVTLEEAGYELFIPDTFYPSELPDGQPNADTFCAFYVSENEDAYISAQLVPTDWTLDDYWEFLNGYEEVEDPAFCLLNGSLFIVYFMPSGDSMCLATMTDKGILEFTFYPDSDSGYADLSEIVGASIQKTA